MACLALFATSAWSSYRIGAAKADITGPVRGPLLLGYANPSQRARGLNMRLFAHALVVEESESQERIVIVNNDICQLSEAIRQEVLARLQKIYGPLYNDRNVLLTATHTHSSLGGTSHYYLYTIASLGYEAENFEAIVSGITQSIVSATQNLKEGSIAYSRGEILDASQNRSLSAFLKDPESRVLERNVPTQVDQLTFRDGSGHPMALWNVFAVHGTSLPNSGHLVSGDNKGYAARILERETGMIAAFANGPAGDVSPKPMGRDSEDAIFEGLRHVGQRQVMEAKKLIENSRQAPALAGPMGSALMWVEFPKVEVDYGRYKGKTCEPAIGYSMIAGAQDGPGSLPGIHQGIVVGQEGTVSRFTRATLGLLKRILGLKASKHEECQGPKPVLFDTWSSGRPGTPRVLPLQLLRLGKTVIAAVPFEATTVSGLRIRKTLTARLSPLGIEHVILVCYANAYTGYLATPEEYDVQNYEGASTHFGRLTLPALQQNFEKLVDRLVSDGNGVYGQAPAPTPVPSWQGAQRATTDRLRDLKYFGAVIQEPEETYSTGDIAETVFRTANPANDLRTGDSYIQIERWQNGTWVPYLNDADPETSIEWQKEGQIQSGVLCKGCFKARVKWRISKGPGGLFRFRYTARAKLGAGENRMFGGVSHEFKVLQEASP